MRKKIFITGEPELLEARLPKKSLGFQLEWSIVPVIEFHRLSAQIPKEAMPTDWIFFPSARAVEFWIGRPIDFKNAKIACMGPETAKYAEQLGWKVDFVPSHSGTESFIKEFKEKFGTKTLSLILPCAKAGRKALIEHFQAEGWKSFEVPVYETKVLPHLDSKKLERQIEDSDLLVFTSPSSLKAVLSVCRIPPEKEVACLGTYTAGFLKKAGFTPWMIAPGEYASVGKIWSNDV